jgi:hypothetical protein
VTHYVKYLQNGGQMPGAAATTPVDSTATAAN